MAIEAQGLNRAAASAPGRGRLKNLLRRLGVLQIDSVNALVRAHYLPLFSRLGPYSREDLDHLTWGRPVVKREFFEYWGHEASFMPIELYPLMRWRMKRAAAGEGIYKGLARFGREEKAVVKRVLKAVAETGPTGAGALNESGGGTGAWWGWSPEKTALEWLFAVGEVSISSRKGFERLYDLTERVIPDQVLKQAGLDEAEAQRRLLLRSAEALGVATEKDLRDYYRLPAAAGKAGVAALVESGELKSVEVEGWSQPAYCPTAVRIPRSVRAECLISPFDSLIWERDRTLRLFDFHYRLEFYTPAHKRVYGYHVLPFLYGTELVGRIDLKADRAAGALKIPALFSETEGFSPEVMSSLADKLIKLADWLGLVKIEVSRRGSLEKSLAEQLKAFL